MLEKDFQTTINNWKSLKSKVDRHLDVVSDMPRFTRGFMSMPTLGRFTDPCRGVVLYSSFNSVF